MTKMKLMLYGLVFICFMDLFVQLPVMGPLAKSLGAGSFVTGLAVGLYSLTNMFGNLAAGIWIDRVGGKIVLITGFICTACVLLMYLLVNDPIYLLIVRFVHGLAGGLLVPSAFTLISKFASKGSGEGKAMALSGAAVGLAAIVGPAAAGILKARVGLDLLFLYTAVLLFIGALIALIWAPRDDRSVMKQIQHINSNKLKQPAEQQQASFTSIFNNKPVIQSYIGAFSLMFAMGALTYALPLKADQLSFPDQTAGLLLSTFGIVAILVFVLPVNKLFDRVPPLKLIFIGGLFVVISLLLLSLLRDKLSMYIVMGFYGLGFALLFPSLNALLIRNVTPENKGKAFGLFYAFFSIGVVAGSSGLSALSGYYDDVLRLAGAIIFIAGIGVCMWHKLEKQKKRDYDYERQETQL
ncbi:Inner membrane transport protein YajR [compost metagenome]